MIKILLKKSMKSVLKFTICAILEEYANKNYIDAKADEGLSGIWLRCQNCELDGDKLESNAGVFETLQDIFMGYVYLVPGIKKISSITGIQAEDIDISDQAAILSLMYERFGQKPIAPERVESGAISRIGTGDVLAALVNLENTSLEDFTIAEKIYTYMIEVKYKNNDVKLAGWLKEAEEILGSYSILDATDYDVYMKAYREAFELYGQDTAYDTLLDYGCVLTPHLFESKTSLNEATEKFAKTLKKYFGNSSFYHNRNNPNFVAKSYAMAKKMCENTEFCDITDIYAVDMDVVSHTKGFDSSDIILLADTQVVQLQDSYGEECDSDGDTLLDYQEANSSEDVDITDFLRVYCKYNNYTEEETRDMIEKNRIVKMYNYSSNPVLPDSDFDGRLDNRDNTKLNNEYDSINETNNYDNVHIKFAQDYRYFFMDSEQYYEELAEMGLVLSNMASKKNGRNKRWTNNNTDDNYNAYGVNEYMWYMGNENMFNGTDQDVPYIIGQHDTIMLMGKVNNAERTVITVAIGEKDGYKDILAANYDGSLGNIGNEDIHHQGYDYEAEKIYDKLVEYDANLSNPRWKKAYFITGYGTGGAVANLVAKKFIDYKKNDKNIYCYTYQAPGTINKNKIEAGKKISNIKYYSIFNIINTDDPLMYLDYEDFDKYGRDKKVEAGFSKNLTVVDNRFLYNEQASTYLMNAEEGEVIGFSNSIFSNVVNLFKEIIDSISMKVSNVLSYAFLARTKPMNEVMTLAEDNGEQEEAEVGIDTYMKNKPQIESSKDQKYVDNVLKNNAEIPGKISVISKTDVKVGATLKSLDELGVWYVNHVATYGSKLKGDNDYYNLATNVARKYFDDRVTKNTINGQTTYRIKDEYRDVDLYMISDQQLGSGIGRLGYKYDKLEEYAEKCGDTVGEPLYAGYVGDDCNSFTTSVIRLTTKGQRGKTGYAGNTDGIDIQQTNADAMMRVNDFEKSMLNLGFHKYYLKSGKWRHKYIEENEVKDNETEEVTGIKFLQPGDILVCSEHVEFYNGFAYDVTYNDKYDEYGNIITNQSINDKKKNGISHIERKDRLEPGQRKKNKDVYEIENTGKKDRAYSTFSWGSVRDEYPTDSSANVSYYFSYDKTTKEFKLNYSASNGQEHYKVIWRKG